MEALLAFLLSALRLATPLIFAALGGVLSERVGVIALHLESVMLGAAFASVGVTALTGSAVWGVLVGLMVGGLLGLLHAYLTQALRVPHILSGVALNLGVLGFTTFALRQAPTGINATSLIPAWLMIAIAFLALLGVSFLLYRTAFGLRLRACGENPKAAQSAGLSVERLRYSTLALSGALTGLAGITLGLTGLGAFTENMTAGRGYIALAAVIFGRWHPWGAVGAALLFGAGDALQLSLQTAGLAQVIPPDVLSLLPYILTLIVLAAVSGKSSVPAALGETE
jgi:simple sugar transport system permease protein